MSLRRPGGRARLVRLAAACLTTVCLAAGCASERGPAGRGVVHVVRPGETIWRISRHYGVSVESVVRANHIRDVTDVPTGARLWIPAAHAVSSAGIVPARYAPPPGRAARERARRELHLSLAWPVQGTLTSRYGRRNGRPHDGVDLAAPRGTPIRAAEAGKVIYSGTLSDYGKVVIVKHVGDFSTVYAHNRRNRVSRGQFVEKGDVIAEVGRTGNATGNHVHFELRDGQRPVDPLPYLP